MNKWLMIIGMAALLFAAACEREQQRPAEQTGTQPQQQEPATPATPAEPEQAPGQAPAGEQQRPPGQQ